MRLRVEVLSERELLAIVAALRAAGEDGLAQRVMEAREVRLAVQPVKDSAGS